MTYDANGNVLTRTAPGQSSSYVYDKLNRRTSETLNGVTTTYTYDKLGNLKTLTDASGTVTYGYDAANSLTAISSPKIGGGTETTGYDPGYQTAAGATTQTVTATLPGGGKILQTFDRSGKLIRVEAQKAGSQTLKQTFSYGTAKNYLQSKTTQIGNTSSTTTGEAYTYDVGGQLKTVTASTNGTATGTTAFTYDAAGNRTSRVYTPTGGSPTTTTWAYNENNQLCWSLNAASSTLCKGKAPGGVDTGSSTPSPYGGPPSGATTYTYDKAGNQLTGGITATWDAKGRIDLLGSSYSSILSPNNNELVALGSDTFTNTALGVSRITVGGNTTALTSSRRPNLRRGNGWPGAGHQAAAAGPAASSVRWRAGRSGLRSAAGRLRCRVHLRT
ncbi:MAG: RHS repeat protein [Patulibacter minatonensis]